MEKFIRTVFISFTTWVAASLINALLVAVWSVFFTRHSGEFLSLFGMVLVFSLLFSIPAIFIFWIFFIANYNEERLFQMLLQTALFTSFFSAFIFFGCYGISFKGENFWLGIFTVVAAISSLMIHHTPIKNIVANNKNQTDV